MPRYTTSWCYFNRCKLIRSNKSANRRIIVSAIQIVESGLAIEIVTSVTEGIIGSSCGCAAIGIGYGSIAPSVVGVRNQLGSCLVVYRNDISLQVLLIPISVEYTLVVVFKGEGRTSLGQSRKLALIVVNISVLGAVIIIPYFLDIIKVIVYISYRKIILDGYFT